MPRTAHHAACVALSTIIATSTAVAGPLTPPPGAPSSTNTTLQQVEPRTPIINTDTTIVITEPGSYYLASNIRTTSIGIEIQVGGVTIDLNGFVVEGSRSGLTADAGVVVTSSATGGPVVIRDGTVRRFSGNGFDSSASFVDVHVADVHVEQCRDGFDVAGDALIERSSATFCDRVGFQNAPSSVIAISHCFAVANGAAGFALDNASIRSSAARNNQGVGFDCGRNSTVANCLARFNELGFSASDYAVITDSSSV
ncbi:MAG: hypothetical protein AAFY58_05120, partial [Planctomycetota bacterium]